MRHYKETLKSTRALWMPLMLMLMLMLLLSGCGKTEIYTGAVFPEMTTAQVNAIKSCRVESPELDEWWVRYVKAWKKAAKP